MKIVKILGGLGNQMFQYALAVKLQHIYGRDEIRIDSSCFNGYPLHNGFELPNVFPNARIPEASFLEIVRTAYPYRHYRLWQIGSRILPARKSMIVEGSEARLDLDILHDDRNLYFDGYWQEENYFRDIRPEIIRTFRFTPIEDYENQQLLEVIEENESMSIHIRRGDYVNHPLYKDICTDGYYRRAIREMRRKRPGISCVVIFSNDIEWCKQTFREELRGLDKYFVDWNKGKNSFRDMQLMSLCNHNIIANSSFSWWGAWLNVHEDKTVIAPYRWINGKSQQKTICDSWRRIFPE